jgi:hypothetical protein
VTLEERAKALWDAGGNRPALPDWEQLGEVTKSVWLERAQAEAEQEEFGDLA